MHTKLWLENFTVMLMQSVFLPLSIYLSNWHPLPNWIEMTAQVQNTVVKTNAEDDLVIKRFLLCFDMKFITFGIDDN